MRQRTGATRLGDDLLGADGADAGDLIEPCHQIRERGSLLCDPGVQGSYVGADRIHPGQHRGKQESVMAGEVTGERLFQDSDLLAHAAPG